MTTPGRLVPHVAMAILTVLAVGAIVLSLEQAPPVADTLLHAAAANTAGVPRVLVDEQIDQVVGATARPIDQVTEELDSPTGIEVQQCDVVERLIGTAAYVSANGGATWYRDASAHVDLGQVTVALHRPLTLLEGARHVVAHAGQTRFTFVTTGEHLVRVLHLALQVPPDAGPVPVTVSVSGEFVTAMTARFAVRGETYVFRSSYRDFDAVAPLTVPPVAAP
jgi:hypothetical protein